MKKKLISFAVVTSFVAILLSSCNKPTEICTPNKDILIGGYSGEHSILDNTYKFDDSLTISNPTTSDRKISIKSERLGTTIIGTFDNNNCSRVTLDSIFITSQEIESVTLNNIRAAGYGIISGNKIQTVINIKSGSANLGGFIIQLSGQSLKGTFTKQ